MPLGYYVFQTKLLDHVNYVENNFFQLKSL
jgi:hypothetical protein